LLEAIENGLNSDGYYLKLPAKDNKKHLQNVQIHDTAIVSPVLVTPRNL
jgi:hypothetical protein